MKRFIRKILIYFRSLIHFSDEIDYENASTSIRKNIAFKGTNVFILACAIIIASVGLNVNSIPVIIGAMLVSPVMGPILGFGLGLGTEDAQLLKDSLKNLGVMVGISIIASSLFFLLSPLSLANPSELLARTNPTIYDVLIALFGGLAGIIEISRKDKGTVISGVAITLYCRIRPFHLELELRVGSPLSVHHQQHLHCLSHFHCCEIFQVSRRGIQ